MEAIYFQALFNQELDFADFIKKRLLQISKDNDVPVNDDNFFDFLKFNYTRHLSNNRFLIGFQI